MKSLSGAASPFAYAPGVFSATSRVDASADHPATAAARVKNLQTILTLGALAEPASRHQQLSSLNVAARMLGFFQEESGPEATCEVKIHVRSGGSSPFQVWYRNDGQQQTFSVQHPNGVSSTLVDPQLGTGFDEDSREEALWMDPAFQNCVQQIAFEVARQAALVR